MKKVIWALLLIALGVAAALYFTKDNQPQEEQQCCECCAECDSAATCETCDSTAACGQCDSTFVAE